MDHDLSETVEQQAIELVSSLGKEHLFVANCPSDIDADKYSGTVITYEEAFDHSDAGVGLCLLLPKAFVLQKFVDMSLSKNISVHFVFTCPSNTSEFDASAWLYNLLHDKVRHIGFMQNLGITFCSSSHQEKYFIACQVEPNAEYCQVSWTQPDKTLEYVFPRTVVERSHTVSELQNLPNVNCIDFRRPNGCHRISDKIDVTSLTVQIANDSLADIELVEKSIQPTIDAAWTHGLAECQVKHFFPWNDKHFQDHFPHGITMSVLDLKSFPDTKLSEILVQLAKLKVRYHFMNYKRLAIFGPASLVINLHLALIPVDIHLPIGPKQGAFTIHMTRSEPQDAHLTNDGNHFRVKYGKIGSFQYTPAQTLWNDIHSLACDEDQLVQSPLGKLLNQKLGAVNFSIRWCQVDLSQQKKCLCFDIDIKHEDALPIMLNDDLCQVAIQHQCPSAEAFRAEIPLTEIETRRDHWNKVVAQQMIPKEGRVSHISFEQDKKQSARRYYDLRTTVIDSMHDYTNIITIASQPPAWFFSPKELTLSFKECLREINYCDNSFIQESFTTNPDTVELELRHHEFIKYRDYHKWLFYHIILGPEQCFHLKSIHLERDEWKVRYYDELIIRTFEQASIFITLPPGISVSQVIDKTDYCHLRNAYTCTELSQLTPNVSTAHAGMKDQCSNTTPSKNFVNGNGMSHTNCTRTRGQHPSASHSKRPAYCPPSRPRQMTKAPNVSPESDIEMAPAHEKDTGNPNQNEKHHHQVADEQSEDVLMECKPTAIDSDGNSPRETTQVSHQTNDNGHKQNASTANGSFVKDTPLQRNSSIPKQDSRTNHLSSNNTVASEQSQPAGKTVENHNDLANVGYPRLTNDHQTEGLDTLATVANAGSSRLDNVMFNKNSAYQPIPASTKCNTTNSPTTINSTTNPSPVATAAPKDHHSSHAAQSSPMGKKCRQSGKSDNPPRSGTHQALGTIKDLFARNTAYRQIDNGNGQLNADDDVLFIGATVNPSYPSVENILCNCEQSRNLLSLSKEIIAGWPNSFAHADSEYFAKLAACYLINFPSYMCYAVSALRVLTHAPWHDNMFHGHIRELVLCAIGNGWTWRDQTATVQGRRVSTGEICAAIASYMNQKAFPPGQVSDLDTAIIAVCDDLFPDHCEFFLAQFKVNCLSCGTSGQVSVPLFDTRLIVNLEDDTVDLTQMLACRNPRLALDRDDVGHSHAPDCTDNDQLSYEQIAGCLLFTLKITSPIEQLPPAVKTLNFLGQSFNVHTIGTNPVSQMFVVTGIIIVQGKSSHHFLIIERCHEAKVLLYDNLQGHKWIPIEQLSSTSFVWGFILRQQDHPSYSFQPEQYKAIAPDALTANRQTHGPKQSKVKQKNTLGVNARRYNFPKQLKKISGNDATPTHSVEEPQQKQIEFPTEPPPLNEILHPDGTPSHTVPAHSSGHDQHGAPMVGTSLCNLQHCPPAQHEVDDSDQNNQRGVPVADTITDPTHHCAHTRLEDSFDKDADGQRGVPTVSHPTNNQHAGTLHPPCDDINREPHPLPHSHITEDTVPVDTSSNAQTTALEPSKVVHTPSCPDGDDKKSIVDLLILRNPQSQDILYLMQLTSLLRVPVIAIVSPLQPVGMPSTAQQVEIKMPLLPNESSIQMSTHMLSSAFLHHSGFWMCSSHYHCGGM